MSKEDSRTSNIARNVVVTIITQILLLFFAFVNRTFFIKLLGEEYLGLDGLFTSLLTIFSLAELGIGNALIFSLYKPIAENNVSRCQQYLTLYDKAYRWIIGIIITVGLCIIPFLKTIVNTDLNSIGVNLYVVYILFLLNTVSSYFLAHRQAVLIINQRQSTVSIYQTTTKFVVYIFECMALLVFSSYYIFLLIRVVGNYVVAILLSQEAKRKYPDLCLLNKEHFPAVELRRIKKNVYALFIRRVGGVVLASTDNIVINSYISLGMVGIYSNYVLIVSSIQAVTTQMMSAMTASIGNFVATQTKNDSELAFELYTFITYLVYGFCSVCFIVIVNKFIFLLWGPEYLLSKWALYLIVLNFFFYGFQSAINVFRDTTGLFVQGKYRSLVSAFVNVAASIILVKYWGIEGVILGTIVSRVLVSAWYDPYILYKYFFNQSCIAFFAKFVIYMFTTFVISALFDWLSSFFTLSISGFMWSALLAILSSLFLVFPFVRTSVARDLFSRVKNVIIAHK